MTSPEKLIEVAKAEVGYLEKKSNSQLENKTSNAGSANYTKYGKWYGINPGAWCAMFVSWCAMQAAASDIIPKHASCSLGVEAWKKLGRWYSKSNYSPKPGDIIYFTRNGSVAHVGLVTKVTKDRVYTIEGNTSSGNYVIPNGGAVCEKDYSKMYTYIYGYGSPNWPKEEQKPVNTVKGSTKSEDKMIRATQQVLDSVVDGEAGTQYFSDVACKLNAPCFPVTLKIYGAPVIIAKNIVPFAAKGATLSSYSNTINGSFYAGKMPCSILIQDGKKIHDQSCHIYYDKPESVIYRTRTGVTGIKRVKYASELPGNLLWAVGGVGLLNNYDPVAEGFCKCTKNGKTEDFSDVLNTNNHSMLGEKHGYMYLVYCANMSGAQVNELAKKFKFNVAIMMDGGHVAGINGEEDFAKINTKSTYQYYMIQGVK